MDAPDRPMYFYLFPEGNDIKIEQMTDTAALDLWRKGRQWIGVGMKTREEAEAQRTAYLSEQSH